MFPFPVLEQSVVLQRADDVIAAQPRVLAQLCRGEWSEWEEEEVRLTFDGEGAAVVLARGAGGAGVPLDGVPPVAPVGDEPQV